MGNNDLTNSDNILVRLDQNNLIYIDPNSVMGANGEIEPRGVKAEELVIYAKLEADLVPRSVLVSESSGEEKKDTLFNVAQTKLNLNGSKSGDFNTAWSDAFNPEGNNINEKTKVDGSEQSFGIDNILISTKTGSIPQVNIRFIDARGKALFESGSDSPYRAFFHLPWPVFYLTIKGYYGKAIRYRLHLTAFSSNYDETEGNFIIDTTFIGSTYAYMSDIPVSAMINCPYMFAIENSGTDKENENTGKKTVKASSSSRGYSTLKAVYRDYIQKGYLAPDFPTITLKELGTKANNIERILEGEIFGDVVDMGVFNGLKELEGTVQNFRQSVIAWGKVNLSTNTSDVDGVTHHYLLREELKTKIKGAGQTLETLLATYKQRIKENELFRNEKLNTGGAKFSKLPSSLDTVKSIDSYHKVSSDHKTVVAIDKLVNDINLLKSVFEEQKKILQDAIEARINKVMRDPKKGLGFEPTVKNIFAVILANAEVYIRMMRDTHRKAFEAGKSRKDRIVSMSSESKADEIYPWPQIKKKNSDGKQDVLAYPGNSDLIPKLGSDNASLWPEVEFVESFMTMAASNASSDDTTYVFDGGSSEESFTGISLFDTLRGERVYSDKTLAGFFYELYERANYTSLIDSFDNKTLSVLADIESLNIETAISEDRDLVTFLRKIIDKGGDMKSEELFDHIKGLSPQERYWYLVDNIPTTKYIGRILDKAYVIEEQDDAPAGVVTDPAYNGITEGLKNFKAESYRNNIYPFNSTTYASYTGKKYSVGDLSGAFEVKDKIDFISTKMVPSAWVKNDFRDNIFTQPILVGNQKVNILNTPIFHTQLFKDFEEVKVYGRYAASAYLLLNSLPFIDLTDEVSFDGNNGAPLSSLFKEVNATHRIPYHLMVKWGSIYHRYKKHITDGVDLLADIVDNGSNVKPTNGEMLFSNNANNEFTVNGKGYKRSDMTAVGLYPFYQSVYNQIVNGYLAYNVVGGDNEFVKGVSADRIKTTITRENNIDYFSVHFDNSKYDSKNTNLTLLPSNGQLSPPKRNTVEFGLEEQNSLRLVWFDDATSDMVYDGLQYAKPNEHLSNVDGVLSMNGNHRKVIDLIATFSPAVLEEFEYMFLEFASSKEVQDIPLVRYKNVAYPQFQDLLSALSNVPNGTITGLPSQQKTKFEDVTAKILSESNQLKLKLFNAKEINPQVLDWVALNNTNGTFATNRFHHTQLTPKNRGYIKLYIGEDMDGYYEKFFTDNDIELSEDNVLTFRSVVMMYAGFLKEGLGASIGFSEYVSNSVFLGDGVTSGATVRRAYFIDRVLRKLANIKYSGEQGQNTIQRFGAYNDDILKLEVYNTFKSFNDKWSSGNSIGHKLLIEEFLFLDKANRDIGDKVYIGLDKIAPLIDSRNLKQNLYGVISTVCRGSDLDMRALPAYVNFYGQGNRVTPSKKVANNIFGTFLEVDYQEASPKIIIQFVGNSSQHLSMDESSEYRFKDDGFNIGSTVKNQLLLRDVSGINSDLSKSNRVVAFEVGFGDQNQSIFTGVGLNQTTIKNTSAAFEVLENIGRSESGAGTYSMDVNLYDYYKQAAYSCEVSCMGNAMIQPTMFFYLKNIPMFRGSYWITDVSHKITAENKMTTNFTGTRIPYTSLPDPKDTVVANYKRLYDKLANKAINLIRSVNESESKTDKVIVTKDGAYVVDAGAKLIQGEEIVNEAGITSHFIPFNGYGGEKDILKVVYSGTQRIKYGGTAEGDSKGNWLRAVVVEMGGKNYPISDDTTMSLVNRVGKDEMGADPFPLRWSELRAHASKYYAVRYGFERNEDAKKVVDGSTQFFNPTNGKGIQYKHEYRLNSSVSKKIIANGPITEGPKVDGYGIALSHDLMVRLGLKDGDVVYFRN